MACVIMIHISIPKYIFMRLLQIIIVNVIIIIPISFMLITIVILINKVQPTSIEVQGLFKSESMVMIIILSLLILFVVCCVWNTISGTAMLFLV